MTGSLLTLPLRLGVRTARASLLAGRDLVDLGLATLDVVERAIGEEPERRDEAEPVAEAEPIYEAEPIDEAEPVAEAEPVDEAEPIAEAEPVDEAEPAFGRGGAPPVPPPPARTPVHPVPPAPEVVLGERAVPSDEQLPDDRELVEEFADPGAEEGAGASLRVAPPFPSYDELRAADVIDRLRGVDTAELGATELYERTHRGRRTVLDAIVREIKRRPPQ